MKWKDHHAGISYDLDQVLNIGKRTCLCFFYRMLKKHSSCQGDWCDILMLGQRMMLTWVFGVPWQWWLGSCFGHMFLTHLCLPMSQIRQVKLPCFKLLNLDGTENIETVETDLEKLVKRSYDDSSLSFNVTSYSDSIMDWFIN